MPYNYETACVQVAGYLGWPVSGWDDKQLAELDSIIQSGYRQFLYPPVTEGGLAGYQWSFVRGLSADPGDFTDDPLGGVWTHEVIAASCLAAAEAVYHSEHGVQWQRFISLLTAAIIRDKRDSIVNVGGDSYDYDGLRQVVGAYLGYGAESNKWSDAQEDSVDAIIQSGVRQFYYPPRVDGMDRVYVWPFLNPVGSLELSAGENTYDLPSDFGGMSSEFVYAGQEYSSPVQVVNEGVVRSKLADGRVGRPVLAGIRYKTVDGALTDSQEVVFYPVPDADYSVSFDYNAYAARVSTSRDPLGGPAYGELIISSCLAVAEGRKDGKRGVQWDMFSRNLLAAIERDRRSGARVYGTMYGGDLTAESVRRVNSEVYYNGVKI